MNSLWFRQMRQSVRDSLKSRLGKESPFSEKAPTWQPSDEEAAVAVPQMDDEGRRRMLQSLKLLANVCRACPLGPARMQAHEKAVPGEGPLDPLVFVVAERPGYRELRLGQPMVGPTATIFQSTLAFLGIDVEQSYRTNSVKCGGLQGRRISTDQWSTCSSIYLHRQILICRPRVILAFGNTAFDAVMTAPYASSEFVQALQKANGHRGALKDANVLKSPGKGHYQAKKSFDKFGARFVPYPLDPSIPVWWSKHYAALAREPDTSQTVIYTEDLTGLRQWLSEIKQNS